MHDNLIRGFGYNFKPPYMYIAMELCEHSLHDEIEAQDGIGPEAFRQLLKCTNEGFKCLVKHSIVHGDVKPENILVANGIYKLADFGLSMFANAEEKLQMAGGSFFYCHPDVFESNFWRKIGLSEMPTRSLPSQIDIYSIGVTLFKSISNKLPFIASGHKEMYELITKKSKNSVRGIEVNGSHSYYDTLPKCTLQGYRKEMITKLLVQLLKVSILHDIS